MTAHGVAYGVIRYSEAAGRRTEHYRLADARPGDWQGDAQLSALQGDAQQMHMSVLLAGGHANNILAKRLTEHSGQKQVG